MFVSLHTHSDGSPQDGAQTIETIVKAVKSYGQNAVALTDHGRCGGLLQLKQVCEKNEIKPIYGLEAYVAPTSRHLKEKVEDHKTSYHITLLAQNEVGLGNIIQLCSQAWIEGFYYKPRIDMELLTELSEGVIALSGCSSGRVCQMFLNDRPEEAEDHLLTLRNIFRDRLYVEVQNHGIDWQMPLKKYLFSLSEKFSIPIVATQDAHYSKKEDADLHKYICKIAAGDLSFECTENYLKTEEQMEFMFEPSEYHAIKRTQEIADRCICKWETGKTIWPVYTKDDDPFRMLSTLAKNKLYTMFSRNVPPEYSQRLDYELGIIKQMGFSTYFLVVQDFINWAKKNSVGVGSGRGSAAGSLVCYALGITGIDPIKYELYFERFLNPSRVSLPDIDTDFDPEGRKRVLDYLVSKYGREQVSQIGTYAVFKPRGALRDFARAMEYGYEVGDKLSAMIPPAVSGIGLSFDECIKAEPKLLKTDYPELVNMARRAEGLKKQAGVHAAGVVISNSDIRRQVPLFLGNHHEITTQFDMHDVEDYGLVKYDFLGLKNLAVIRDTVELVKKYHGVEIDISKIDVEDQNVYQDIFQRGRLDGVFQFETSSGLRDLCMRVRPRSIEDLAALNALFRPGPLCLSGSCDILTGIEVTNATTKKRSYKYKKLSDLYEFFLSKSEVQWKRAHPELVSYNEETCCYTKSRIKKIWKSGIKKLYKLNVKTSLTKEGNTEDSKIHRHMGLKASAMHRFLTLEGWKQLCDIEIGEYLCVVNKVRGIKKSKNETPGRKNFRNIALYNYKYNCVFCDWKDGSLDVNHVNGNRNEDNSPENLSFLCPNHHRMYSEGNISKESLIENRKKYEIPIPGDFMWVRLEGIEEVGEEETFDIEVDGPNHNFIANDFVVHNSTGLVDKYVAVRNGEDPEYLIPELEPILKNTAGTMTYQEQIMRICTDVAGYTLSEADNMRRIIGKKQLDKMKAERTKFVEGCKKNGVDEKDSSKLFDDIEGFAAYSFNKSHAVAYSMISYHTAWLKRYYPHEFYTSLLNSSLDNQADIIKYMYAANEDGITVLPPDVNRSDTRFSLDNETILFGLVGIKSVGEKACEALIKGRPEDGFKDLADFLQSGVVNSGVVRALAESGALTSLGEMSRGAIVSNVASLLEYHQAMKEYKEKEILVAQREAKRLEAMTEGKKPPSKLRSKEKPEEPVLNDGSEISKLDLLAMERKTLGSYVTGHPLDSFPSLAKRSKVNVRNIIDGDVENRSLIMLPVVISSIVEKRTRKGKNMAVLQIEDKTGRIEATVFNKTWVDIKDKIQEDMVVMTSCMIERQTVGDGEEEQTIVRVTLRDIGSTNFKPEVAEVLCFTLGDGTKIEFVPVANVDMLIWKQGKQLISSLRRT